MREEILQKANSMFLNYGFKSVTMDDLAEKMGISKKTIYAHFENKTRLVEASTMNVFEKVAEAIDAIVADQKNPIEELYEIKKAVMMHLKDEKASPIYQLQKYYPQIYQTLREKQYEVMQHCVVDNLSRGMAMGIYRHNLNIGFIARFYFAGANILKDGTLFPPEEFSMPVLMDNFLEYHLRGIVTPVGRKKLNEIINSNLE